MMDVVTPFLYDDLIPGDVLATCERGRWIGFGSPSVCVG
jgi:hypothetical protein